MDLPSDFSQTHLDPLPSQDPSVPLPSEDLQDHPRVSQLVGQLENHRILTRKHNKILSKSRMKISRKVELDYTNENPVSESQRLSQEEENALYSASQENLRYYSNIKNSTRLKSTKTLSARLPAETILTQQPAGLKDQRVTNFSLMLKNLASLTSLTLSLHSFTEETVNDNLETLFHVLKNAQRLQSLSLDLSNNFFLPSNRSQASLIRDLACLRSLTSFEFKFSFTDQGENEFNSLLSALKQMRLLKSLKLSFDYNQINNKSIKSIEPLAKLLIELPFLETFHWNCSLDNQDLACFAETFVRMEKLIDVRLNLKHDLRLDDSGLIAFAQSFPRLRLKSLELKLGFRAIETREGVMAIFENLGHLKQLQKLKLVLAGYEKVSTEEFEALTVSLQELRKLTSFGLTFDGCRGITAEKVNLGNLMTALKESDNLGVLCLDFGYHYRLGDQEAETLALNLSEMKSLSEIQLSFQGRTLNQASFLKLGTALKGLESLSVLAVELNGCYKIGENAIVEFAKDLERLPKLAVVELLMRNIKQEREGMVKILNAFGEYQSLESLTLLAAGYSERELRGFRKKCKEIGLLDTILFAQ